MNNTYRAWVITKEGRRLYHYVGAAMAAAEELSAAGVAYELTLEQIWTPRTDQVYPVAYWANGIRVPHA